jgi:hypothetical protein
MLGAEVVEFVVLYGESAGFVTDVEQRRNYGVVVSSCDLARHRHPVP